MFFKKELKFNQLAATVGNQIEITSSPKEYDKYKNQIPRSQYRKIKPKANF